MGTPLASVFVEGRIDFSRAPEDIRRGLSSGAVSSSAASAGKKTGTEFGSKFSTGVVETGRKGTTSLFEQAEKGAVMSGLGIGRRAGQSITKGLGEYAKIAATTVAGYFAAEKVKEFFTASFEGAERLEKQERLTEAAIASTGGAANVSAEDIDKLTGSLEAHSSASQLDIRASETLLLRFTDIRNELGKDNDIYDRANQMVLDLSAATGRSLPAAALVLGKALNAPVTGLSALTRVGVQFTDQQKAQIATLVQSGDTLDAQKLILDSLGKKYAGAAEAASTPIDHLKQSFQDLEIEVGQKMLPVLSDGASLLITIGGDAGTLAHLIGEVPAPLRDVALAMLAFKAASSLGVFSAIETGWTLLRVKVLETGDAIATANLRMAAMRGAAGIAGIGLAELSTHAHGTAADLAGIGADAALGFSVGGPWGAAVGGAVGLLTHLGGAAKITTTDVDSLTGSFNTNTGAITQNTREMVANTLEQNGTFAAARTAGLNLGLVTDAALGNQRAIALLRQEYAALNPAVDQSTGSEAARRIALSEGSSATYGASQANSKYADSVKSVLLGVGAEKGAVDEAHQKWNDLSEAMDHNKGEARGTADATKSLADQVSDLNRQLDNELSRILKLNGTNLGLRGDYRAVQQAIDDATAALKQNGITLDINTEKGRNNQAALDSIASSMGQTASDLATRFGVGSKQEVTYLETARHSLERQAVQFGLTKAEAWRYVNTVLGIPKDANTLLKIDRGDSPRQILDQHQALQDLADMNPSSLVSVDTRQAIQDMQSFKNYANTTLDGIKDEPVNITLTAQANKVFNELGGVPLAAGGPITGGTPGRDSVHALLMPGEHVLTKGDVDAMGGHAAVFAMRKAIQGFAAGGPVLGLHETSQGFAGAVGSVEHGFDTIAGKISAGLSAAISKKVSAYQIPGGAGGGSTAMNGSAWGAIAQAARLYNWASGAEWEALVKVVNRESGGNPLAQNPTSTAFGIGQFLDGTWASVGGYKTTDPYLQSIFMDRYIAQRYVDPIGAWAHEVSAGWYDHGGMLKPGWNYNGLTKGELVSPPDDLRDVITVLRDIHTALAQHGIKVKAMPDLGSQVDARAQGIYDANTNWRGR